MIDLRYSSINEPVPNFVLDSISIVSKTINTYPDGSYSELKKVLATDVNTSPDKIFVGNGLDDVIDQLSRFFTEKFIIPTPAFSEFSRAAKRNSKQFISVPCLLKNKLDLAPVLNRPDLSDSIVWIANPNNPTGSNYDENQLVSLAKKSKFLILDEAYYEFSNSKQDFSKYENVIRLRTFSKALGLAGLRLGYLISSKDLVKKLEKIRPLFVLNTFAASAGQSLPNLRKLIPKRIEKVNSTRTIFENKLSKLNYSFLPSSTNFLLVDFKDKQAVINAIEFFKQNDILLLPPWDEEFDGVPDNYIRYVIGSDSQMSAVCSLLQKLEGV